MGIGPATRRSPPKPHPQAWLQGGAPVTHVWARDTINHLQLNTSKTKEMVVDYRRTKPPLQPVSIEGDNVEVVTTYKYLGIHWDNKLDWSANTDALYRKGQSRRYFLRRLRSFNVCSKLLWIFCQSVVASVLSYAVVCWGGSTKKRDSGRLGRLTTAVCVRWRPPATLIKPTKNVTGPTWSLLVLESPRGDLTCPGNQPQRQAESLQSEHDQTITESITMSSVAG
ncbi:hypothetical protein N1851_003531 [Merluccius polli]|uniref:Alkylated DNA repair protein AlkB homologue 8 N-terminal domain-containing protein n=1 Tax=Merluccius polli TaxID=89951 RepID=A0AA47N8I7_MERPO|nr:hypothetical protein N1851_003531 [Merluccius polli]